MKEAPGKLGRVLHRAILIEAGFQLGSCLFRFSVSVLRQETFCNRLAVRVCAYLLNKLHITAQSDPVMVINERPPSGGSINDVTKTSDEMRQRRFTLSTAPLESSNVLHSPPYILVPVLLVWSESTSTVSILFLRCFVFLEPDSLPP